MPTDQWNAKLYDANHGFVHQLGKGVIELLAPMPGERILDLGCGTGPLTQQIANTGAVVIGVDSSPAMIAKARDGFPSLHFEVQDATTMRFDQPFDAIFSNAALHWVKPPEAVIARMHQALKPNGRLVLEMGGKGNIAKISSAAIQTGQQMGVDLTPVVQINYFPSIGDYSTLLENGGFEVELAVLFDRPTPLNDGDAGLRTWIRMFRPGVETAIGSNDRERFYQSLEDLCRAELFCDGAWYADYRRLRIKAAKRT